MSGTSNISGDITRNDTVRFQRYINDESPLDNQLWTNFGPDKVQRSDTDLIWYTLDFQPMAFGPKSTLGTYELKKTGDDPIWTAIQQLGERVGSAASSAASSSSTGSTISTSSYAKLGFIEICGGIQTTIGFLKAPPSESMTPQQKFFNEVSTELSSFLEESECTGEKPSYKPGIWFRGRLESMPEAVDPVPAMSALFIRLPFLGRKLADIHVDTESYSLSEDDGLFLKNSKSSNMEPEYRVHQAIFLAINEEIILTARSKELRTADKNLITFPGQDRGGIFHVLVSMILDTISAEDLFLLEALDKIVSELELMTLRNDQDEKFKPGRHYDFVRSIRTFTQRQVSILKDMRGIFSRSVYVRDPTDIVSNTYTTNTLHTPVVSGKMQGVNEQIGYANATLLKIINGRYEITEKCNKAIEEMRRSNNTLEKQTTALKGAISEQTAQAEQLTEEIAWQGKTLSAFTIVNVIFLPLGFFSQYFTGDKSDRNGKIDTVKKFWLVAGVITFSIALVATFFVFQSQYEGRKVRRCIYDMFTGRGLQWPLRKPDAYSQHSYIKRLKRYRIEAVPCNNDPHIALKTLYLKKPDDLSLRNNKPIKLEMTENIDDAGWFPIDSNHGWLFKGQPDLYDCTYHVHGPRAPPRPDPGFSEPLEWRRSRMITEETPYRFRGRFHKKKESLVWKCAGGVTNQKARFDAKDENYEIFRIDQTDKKLFVCLKDDVERDRYRLKLVKLTK
ncbi:hypothetical protein EDC01DRAFT_728827 [Geopyxis carbonaria]|nr:hypothetical protein EDC01DRAFT_728827 [Geopyxis carbonaria]